MGDHLPTPPQYQLIAPASQPMTQQGAVNWDNLGLQAINFSLGVLKRIADAGVQPFTICMAQVMSNSFRMGKVARRDVHKAIGALRAFAGWEKLLQFGFGVESFPRLMSTTDEGVFCLAFLAALVDGYSVEYAGEVLFHMVGILDPPEKFKPSMSDWTSLSKACAGSMVHSTLPLVVGQMMRLCHGPRSLPVDRNSSEPSESAAIAKVLMAIGDVTRGKLHSITVEGRSNVGLIAALAVWLFDLKIRIQSEDGQVLYSNCSEISEIQVAFNVMRGNPDNRNDTAIQTVSKTYVVVDGRQIFRGLEDVHTFTGRVPWDSCLTYIFGALPGFQDLLGNPRLIGRALGSAAKMFEDLAFLAFEDVFNLESHRQLRGKWAQAYGYLKGNRNERGFAQYGEKPANRGMDLVHRSMQRLPEIDSQDFKDAAISALGSEDPDRVYTACFEELKGCGSCGSRVLIDARQSACECGKSVIAFKRESVEKDSMLRVIIDLCRLLSSAAYLHESLMPSSRGLAKWVSSRAYRNAASPLESLFDFLPFERGMPAAQDLFTIFAGVGHSMPGTWLASSRSGICIFHNSLVKGLDISCDTLFDYSVVPGLIEKEGKTYDHVLSDAGGNRPPYTVGHYDSEDLLLTVVQSGLYAKYLLQGSKTVANEVVHPFSVAPLDLEEYVAKTLQMPKQITTHIKCQCPATDFTTTWGTDDNGFAKTTYKGVDVILLPQASRPALYAFISALYTSNYHCLTQGEWCIGRCFLTVPTFEFKNWEPKLVYILTS